LKVTKGQGGKFDMKKKRVLLLSADSLLGESIERMLSQLEDVELIGPWRLDADVLPRLAGEIPDMALVIQGGESAEKGQPLASQLLEHYPNLPVVRIGLQENVIRVTATRTLPARSAALIELIRSLPANQVEDSS